LEKEEFERAVEKKLGMVVYTCDPGPNQQTLSPKELEKKGLKTWFKR
jgi:hypothetical protein